MAMISTKELVTFDLGNFFIIPKIGQNNRYREK